MNFERLKALKICIEGPAEITNMKRAWVYILKCADGSYYTGHTTNLELRIRQHESGEGSSWTKNRLPIELVFSQEMANKDEAFSAETQLKGWSRAKKEALINNKFDLLKALAKNQAFQQIK